MYPAASLPEYAANRGAYLIDVNLEKTSFSSLPNYVLCKGPAGLMLPAVVKRVFEIKNVPQQVGKQDENLVDEPQGKL